MTSKGIKQATFKRIIDTLEPHVRTESMQTALFGSVFVEHPRLVAQIDYGDSANIFASNAVLVLVDYEILEDRGEEKLAVVLLLERLKDEVGPKKQAEIDDLIYAIQEQYNPEANTDNSLNEAPATIPDKASSEAAATPPTQVREVSAQNTQTQSPDIRGKQNPATGRVDPGTGGKVDVPPPATSNSASQVSAQVPSLQGTIPITEDASSDKNKKNTGSGDFERWTNVITQWIVAIGTIITLFSTVSVFQFSVNLMIVVVGVVQIIVISLAIAIVLYFIDSSWVKRILIIVGVIIVSSAISVVLITFINTRLTLDRPRHDNVTVWLENDAECSGNDSLMQMINDAIRSSEFTGTARLQAQQPDNTPDINIQIDCDTQAVRIDLSQWVQDGTLGWLLLEPDTFVLDGTGNSAEFASLVTGIIVYFNGNSAQAINLIEEATPLWESYDAVPQARIRLLYGNALQRNEDENYILSDRACDQYRVALALLDVETSIEPTVDLCAFEMTLTDDVRNHADFSLVAALAINTSFAKITKSTEAGADSLLWLEDSKAILTRLLELSSIRDVTNNLRFHLARLNKIIVLTSHDSGVLPEEISTPCSEIEANTWLQNMCFAHTAYLDGVPSDVLLTFSENALNNKVAYGAPYFFMGYYNINHNAIPVGVEQLKAAQQLSRDEEFTNEVQGFLILYEQDG